MEGEGGGGVAKAWRQFLAGVQRPGWELWPAARARTRLQIELGKFDDAARALEQARRATRTAAGRPAGGGAPGDRPADPRQGVRRRRGRPPAELLKTAAGAQKERLDIYEIAAKAGGDGKPLDGVDKIKAEMEKTKDPSVHATGFSMMGELYLAGEQAAGRDVGVPVGGNGAEPGQRRGVQGASSRLADMFETAQMDEDQARKYRDKLKRFRGTF